MDRALSFFGVYDVFGYFASGVSAIVGIWWVVEGSIPTISAVGVLGLVGASYIVGQLAATLGHLWESGWWDRKGGKPYVRMIGEDGYEFERPLRLAIREAIDAEVGVEDLSEKQRFTIARSRLRLEGFEGRAETMRAMHGLCRNLAASATVVGLVAVAAYFCDWGEERYLIAAGLAATAAWAFGWRTLRFERRFGREVWLGFLVLRTASRRD